GSGGNGSGGGTDIKGLTAKQFLKQKNPSSDLERLICLAYYMLHVKDAATFSTRDITKLNGEAGGTDFSNAAATANNGVAQSKFLSRAGGGKKRLTNRGEAVVEALPDRAKATGALPASGHRRKEPCRP